MITFGSDISTAPTMKISSVILQMKYLYVSVHESTAVFVTWFCYQMIAKPGNKTATPSWLNSYVLFSSAS